MTLGVIGTVAQQTVAGKVITGHWFDDQRLRPIGMRVLIKAKFTCNYCGFTSKPSKNVQHGWMTPVDLASGGLVPSDKGICLCPVCACSIAINWSVITRITNNVEVCAGSLIYCPWLEQSQVSLLANYCIAVRAGATVGRSSKEEAVVRSIDASFTGLREEIASRIPIYHGQDSDFARALSMLEPEYYRQRADLVGELRFWPNMDYWHEQGRYWKRAAIEPLHQQARQLIEGFV